MQQSGVTLEGKYREIKKHGLRFSAKNQANMVAVNHVARDDCQPRGNRYSSPMNRLFNLSIILCLAAWITHLTVGTLALRGFFGDGAVAFVIHLSRSYVFNTDSSWVHLFSVGFPRDTQLLLNALGLQAALAFHVTDPMTLKYVFNFWQFALPGLLYLGLLLVMLQCDKIRWGIFPLVAWLVLSVPLDWNAVNSSRWAIPIFWMHFMLVLLSGNRLQRWPVVAASMLGLAMLGGLYESVILHCGLCVGVGIILWWREKNKVPFLYALVSVPGAIRAVLTFLGHGHAAPNGFHAFVLQNFALDPYFLFIALGLGMAGLLCIKKSQPIKIISFVGLVALVALGISIFLQPLPNVWLQTEFRYDYVILSLLLMGIAALCRLLRWAPDMNVRASATLTLGVGAVLWCVQIMQTYDFIDCRTAYEQATGDQPLIVDPIVAGLLKPNNYTGVIDRSPYGQCVWDWTAPWGDILLKTDLKVRQWKLFTFWQDFVFEPKDGAVVLHTNNWSLTDPTFEADTADLPLKTLLYDLTPLYQQLHGQPLIPRATCMPAVQSGRYWQRYLMSLNDADRQLLFVCPHSTEIPAP